MITRPRFKDHLHVEVIGSERVFLLSEGRSFTLSGRPHALVAPLVDGRRTADEIVDLLTGEIPAAQVYYALLLLEQHGHIEEASEGLPKAMAAYWHATGITTRLALERLTSRTVSIVSFGDVSASELRAQLESVHVDVTDAETDLVVALVDDYLQPGLEDLNRCLLSEGRPWLLARPNGLVIWVGPLFRPGHSACWACLAQRLRANREVETYVQEVSGRASPFPARAVLPSTVQLGLGMVATAVATWVVTEQTPLDGRLVTCDTLALRAEEHVVVRRPQCPVCGDPTIRAPLQVVLHPRPKTFVADGGHRAASPEEMLGAHRHHISPLTGVARGLVRVTDPTDPIQHVYVSGHNMAVRQDSFQRMRGSVRGSSCGKGMTDAQARASALGEAIERYSGVFRGEEVRECASARALGERGIDPRACMLFSEAQYRDRDAWNARDRRLDMVPLPFDEDAVFDWTPIWSLTRQEPRYLPTSYAYYSYPSPPQQFFCLPDSNGSAAGNTIEEAILQGLLELVERDSVAIWWYNRLRRPAVDLDAFDEPYVQALRQHHHRVGRELWLLDLTTDLGIPSFIAISRRTDKPVEDIIIAPAAHLEPRTGILRALTELNQMMPGVADIRPDGSGEYGYDDPEALHWWRTATLANQPYLAPAVDLPPVRPSDYPRCWTDDLSEDVRLLQATVERQGLELLVLDQTRPDIGLPVVKVIVPGLRHFWARYAPGRLYDVPVSMGLLPAPTPEDGLNPVSIFI